MTTIEGFLLDLEALEAYLARLELRVAVSSVARGWVLSTKEPLRGRKGTWSPVLDGVPVLRAEELRDLVLDDPTVVPLIFGTQFGLTWRRDEPFVRPGRLVAVASYSPLSGSYGSTCLRPWIGTEPNRLGGTLARFRHGVQIPVDAKIEPGPNYDGPVIAVWAPSLRTSADGLEDPFAGALGG